MPRNLVRKHFFGSCTWTAPAGVREVEVEIEKLNFIPSQVATGNVGPAVVNDSGTLYTWGAATLGSGGRGDITPACIPFDTSCSRRWRFVSPFQSRRMLDENGCLFGAGQMLGINGASSQNVCVPTAANTSARFVKPVYAKYQGFEDANAPAYWLGIDGRIYAFQGNANSISLGTGPGWTSGQCSPQPFCFCAQNIKHLIPYGLTTFGLIDNNDQVWNWGVSDCGEAGWGDLTSRNVPTCIDLPPVKRILRNSTCTNGALTLDGRFFTWGSNECGALGIGNAPSAHVCSPVEVLSGCPVKDFRLYPHGFILLTCDGKLFSFGGNSSGMLGIGCPDTTNNYACLPQPIMPSHNFKKLFKPDSKFCEDDPAYTRAYVLDCDDVTWGWGLNCGSFPIGALGVCDTSCDESLCLPTPLCLPNIVRMFGGGPQTWAEDCTGAIYGWGSNDVGGVGVGTAGSQVVIPTPICMPDGFTPDFMGMEPQTGVSFMGNMEAGTLYTWGALDWATCRVNRCVPTCVPLADIDFNASIFVGSEFLLLGFFTGGYFLKNKAGDLFYTGCNTNGQAGNGAGGAGAGVCGFFQVPGLGSTKAYTVQQIRRFEVTPGCTYCIDFGIADVKFNGEIAGKFPDKVSLRYFA